MACWTLWQRLPPRYQLTVRDVRCDEQATPLDASNVSPATSARLRTPGASGGIGSARTRVSGEGVMLTTGVHPEDCPAQPEPGPQSPILPPRSSPYISNMKNTMRINSARRKMDGGLTMMSTSSSSSSSTVSFMPKLRATTAPAFPITKSSNTDDYCRQTSLGNQAVTSSTDESESRSADHACERASSNKHQSPRSPSQRSQKGLSGQRSPKRPSSGYVVVDRHPVTVSTISPFGETRELSAMGQSPAIHHRTSPRQQQCVIGDFQVAALYVDRDRVTFFRKTKPDVTQSVYSALSPYHVNRDDGSYLAHLRKVYLNGVRDLPKVTRKEPDVEKHTTVRQRIEYDRKVGRILDYYSKVDISKEIHSPRPPDIRYATNVLPAPPGQQGFRTIRSRRKGPSRPGALSQVPGPQMNFSSDSTELPSQQAFRVHGHLGHHSQPQLRALESGGFVRINSQARLHDRRHFYLRTPMVPELGLTYPRSSEFPDMSNCACAMCHLEMDVALMAQLHRDLGVSVDSLAAAQIRSNLERNVAAVVNARNNNVANGAQLFRGIAVAEEVCPTRPNSVSETRRPAGSPDRSSVAKHTSTGILPSDKVSGQTDDGSLFTETATESSILTVTLPAIEEICEVTRLDREALQLSGYEENALPRQSSAVPGEGLEPDTGKERVGAESISESNPADKQSNNNLDNTTALTITSKSHAAQNEGFLSTTEAKYAIQKAEENSQRTDDTTSLEKDSPERHEGAFLDKNKPDEDVRATSEPDVSKSSDSPAGFQPETDEFNVEGEKPLTHDGQEKEHSAERAGKQETSGQLGEGVGNS